MFEDIKFYKPTSKQLAIISLLFWIVSLFNVALVSYHGVTMNGLPIVLIGILSGNLAWFANPLLLVILIALMKKSKSKKTIFILLVIILAINTIFLDEFSLSAAGSHIVYGYGLGFILWVISINIAFIAVGIQYQELDFEETKIIGKAILYLGIFSLFSILIGTAFYNTQKYKNASYAEKKKLSTVFLKKGSICTSEINVLFSPLVGALEVFHPTYHGANQPQNPAYMFNSPRKLLYWGMEW